jgi:hypothetical protein
MNELYESMSPSEFRKATNHLPNEEYLTLLKKYYPTEVRRLQTVDLRRGRVSKTKTVSPANKRRKSLEELSSREHGWWEQGATHRTVILDLIGYVPASWESLKKKLLGLPDMLQVVDYMLECVNRVEDGQGDPQWVTLPNLISSPV